MKSRRHHNNTGLRQIRGSKTRLQVAAIAKRLGIPYDDTDRVSMFDMQTHRGTMDRITERIEDGSVPDVQITHGNEKLVARVHLTGGAQLPVYQTPGSAGFDLAPIESANIAPHQTVMLKTGLIIQPPEGHFWMIVPRSSLQKRRLKLANTIGVVDADYCGPDDQVMLPIYNFGDAIVRVEAGERLAQGIFLPLCQAHLTLGIVFPKSRGGFGSTDR